MYKNLIIWMIGSACILSGCKSTIKLQEDKIYSRHLQRHVSLTIISTPVPTNRSEINLLLLNDGQNLEQLLVKKIVDSLYNIKQLKPLIIVGVHAGDRDKEYGVTGYPDFEGRGDKADKYAAFIINELYPFAKKNAGVRKFSSVVISGCSLGGLSALDIAWDHADKIDKVGIFSGALWWRNKNSNDSAYSDKKNRIIINKIRSSKKKPHLSYWFYTGGREETGDRDKDGIIDVTDDTRDVVELIKSKNVVTREKIINIEDRVGIHDYSSWSQQFPFFIIWAFGK